MNPRIILVLALGVQTILAGAAYAENARPQPRVNPRQPLGKKEAPKVEHTTISSISAESITISEHGKAKTYKITKDTEISLKGQKVTADDLKAGMRVTVSMGAQRRAEAWRRQEVRRARTRPATQRKARLHQAAPAVLPCFGEVRVRLKKNTRAVADLARRC
jgi:hypothetical protein